MLTATTPRQPEAIPVMARVLHPENVPQFLRQQKRWALFIAPWNAKRKKFDKIPVDIRNPSRRMSTAAPDRWFGFDETVDAFNKHPQAAGIGFVMTGMEGLVGVDGDDCADRTTGEPNEFANDILRKADTYAELSPSGTGVRAFSLGSVPDFTNHEAGPNGEGLEVYQGDAARFLTVTGRRLPGSPAEIKEAPPELLTHLESYRTKEATAAGKAGDPPPLLPPEQLPSLDGLSQNSLYLPEAVSAWLTTGTPPKGMSDNSRMLAWATASILAAGASKELAFSLLTYNDVAFGLALGKRRHSSDKALTYLWAHHVCAVKVTVALDSDFEALPPLSPAEEIEQAAIREANKAIATARKGKEVQKPTSFSLETIDEYCARVRPMEFDIPGLCPRGEMIFIGGPSGGGKTHFALHMVADLVSEGRMFGRQAQRKARVAWACLEGASGFRSRLLGYRKHYGTRLDGLLMIKEPVTLLSPESVKNLIKCLRAAGGVDYVVVDTWSKATPGADENSSVDMGLAVDLCLRIHRAIGCTVVAVAHVGKDTTKGLRGWSGLKGAADAEIMVEKFTSKNDQTGHRATVTKLKDGQGEGDTFHFEVESVPLAASEGGNAGVLSELCNILPTPRSAPKKWANGVNQLAIQRAIEAEAARRRDLNDPRVLIDTKHLTDAATKERIRMAAAEGKAMTTKTARDGVRDALNALREEGKLHSRGDRMEVKGLETIQSDPYEGPSLAAHGDTEAAPETGNSHPGAVDGTAAETGVGGRPT